MVYLASFCVLSRYSIILQIVEILDYADGKIETSVLYEFQEGGEDAQGKIVGTLAKCNPLQRTEKLRAAGL